MVASRKIAHQQNFKSRFVTYNAYIFSLRARDWTASLTTVEGRERFELVIGDYQRGVLAGSHPKAATLAQRQDGTSSIADWRGDPAIQAAEHQGADGGGLGQDGPCSHLRGL